MYSLPNLFPNIVLRAFDNLIQVNQIDSLVTDSLGHSSFVLVKDTVIVKNEIAIFSSRSQYLYHGQKVNSTIFFSNDSNINPAVTSSYLYSFGSGYASDTSGVFNFSVRRSTLLQSGFSSGDKIYSVVYAYASYFLNDWYDPSTNRVIYSGFSPHHSDVVSFVLP